MQRPLQITFRGMDHSDAIAARVRDEAAELDRFYDHITGAHVVVEAPPGGHHHGGLFSVHLEIAVPQDELVVSREGRKDPAHEDVYVAIRDAFAAAIRQLEDYARRRRDAARQHEEPRSS